MANPFAGEVDIWLDGVRHSARLTLGAMAEMEAGLDQEGIVDLVERFEAGRFKARDLMALILAGLRGAGWAGVPADFVRAQIADAEGAGPVAAARIAARLLAGAFDPAEG